MCAGLLSAKRYRSDVDHAGLAASLIGISIPIFFLAIILKYIFSVRLGWLPSIGREDTLSEAEHPTNFYVLDGIITGNLGASWDAIKHLILPAIALGSIRWRSSAHHPRFGARRPERGLRAHRPGQGAGAAHGRPPPRDAQRLLPVTTIIGLQMGLLLSGAVLTETVFAIPEWARGSRKRSSTATTRSSREDPLPRGRVRLRQPARRHHLRPPEPACQGELT